MATLWSQEVLSMWQIKQIWLIVFETMAKKKTRKRNCEAFLRLKDNGSIKFVAKKWKQLNEKTKAHTNTGFW